jgi:peptide/nickel transport system substrate-binding protein
MATNRHQRLERGNLTRRRFIQSAAAGGTAFTAAALLACGGSNSNSGSNSSAKNNASNTSGAAGSASSAASAPAVSGSPATVGGSPVAAATPNEGTPKQGGTYIIDAAVPSTEPPDPHTSLNRAFFYWGFMGDKLLDQDHANVEPIHGSLVESWEQPDPTTLIFHTRQGVNWHDGKLTNGRAFTAQDVAFNIQRIAGLLNPDRKAQFQRAGELVNLAKASASDNVNTTVTLSAPNAYFLNGLADFRDFVVAPETVQADPNFQNYTNLSGTGPFVIDTYDSLTGNATFKANPKYWKKGLPYLAGVQMLNFADAASDIAAFVAGKTSVVFSNASSSVNRKTIASQRPDAKIVSWPFVSWNYLRMNQTYGTLADPRVRQAIFLGIGYKEMNDATLDPGLWNFTGPLPAGFPGTWTSADVQKLPGFNPATRQQDIANGQKMLAAAGFANGKGVSFEIFTAQGAGSSGYAPIMQDQLSKSYPDIKVSIREAKDSADFSSTLGKGSYQTVLYISYPAPSPALEANLHYRSSGSRNYTSYSDADVDALIDKSYGQLDTPARNATIGSLQQKLLDLMWIIPTNEPKVSTATDPKLRGFATYAGGPGTNGAYDAMVAAAQLWFA